MTYPEGDREDGSPERRFAVLLDRASEGTLAESDVSVLRELLEQSDAHRRAYVRAMHLSAGLRKWACSRGSADIQDLVSLADQPDRDVTLEPANRIERRASRLHLRTAVGLAATLLIAATLWWPSRFEPRGDFSRQPKRSVEPVSVSAGQSLFVTDTQQIVARVVSVSSDLHWTSDAGPPDFLLRLRPGDLVAIDSGVAQVEFTSGAELTLSGDCKLQITSPTSARLLRGMVVGEADGEDAFTVVTPSATVIDVGTRFGVSVGESGTDVSVFDGEVHVHGLQTTKPVEGPVRKLLEGMSVRVDRDGVPGNAPPAVVARLQAGRRSLDSDPRAPKAEHVSLLDLLAGDSYRDPIVGGSIDAVTGFWGRHTGFSKDNEYWPSISADETSFRSTDWNPLIDGVFVPRSMGVATQFSSDGGVIELPASSGESWGPIWSRRKLASTVAGDTLTEASKDFWGGGSFEQATARLAKSRDGLLGLHANVGVTFDLQAIRERAADGSGVMRFVGAITNLDNSQLMEPPRPPSLVGARFYVDGQLRYSRSDFGRSDGEELFEIPLVAGDRFLTLVATDSDGSIHHDHVILIDPRLETVE